MGEDLNIALTTDYFALFKLPPRYHLERARLDTAYRAVLSEVHPDRFVQSDDATKRYALQLATHVNEAYTVLKRPLSRAQYLLKLFGHEIDPETSREVSAAFLIEQMDFHESLGDAVAEKNKDALDALSAEVKSAMASEYAALEKLMDEDKDFVSAESPIRRLMFFEKLHARIEDEMMMLLE